MIHIPSVVSFGKFDASEDKKIVENMENLVKQAKMNSYDEVFDVDPSSDNQVTRIEIIGS